MATRKRCLNCGHFFVAIIDKRKYCSDKCGTAYRYKQRSKPVHSKICKQCKRTFITKLTKKVFCNINCKNIFHKQGIIKMKICPLCHKVFETTNDKKIYCCKEHYLTVKRKRDHEYYLKHRS